MTALIIESDPDLARTMSKKLTSRGWNIDTVHDGKKGIRKYLDNKYDVVLVDYDMPDLTGIQFIEALQEHGDTPVLIMVTGTGDESIATELLRLGVDDCIVKDRDGVFTELIGFVIERALARRIEAREKEEFERQLEQSKEKYRNLVENLNEIVFNLDRDGVLTYISPVVTMHYQYSPEELVGMHMSDLVYKEDYPKIWSNFVNFLKGVITPSEFRILDKKGNMHYAQASSSLVYQDGEVAGLTGTIRDITGKKHGEAERDVTMQLLGLLNKPTDLTELIAGVADVMRQWSGCEEVDIRLKEGISLSLYGVGDYSGHGARTEKGDGAGGGPTQDDAGAGTRGSVCDSTMLECVDTDRECFTRYGSFWTNSRTDFLASVGREDDAERARHTCIEEGYESIALIPLRYGKENLGLLHIKDSRRDRLDISIVHHFERLAENLALGLLERISRQALLENEEKYRTLVEFSPCLIAIHQEHTFVFINRTGAVILGAEDPDEIIGRDILKFIHVNDQDIMRERIAKLMESDEQLSLHDYRVVCLDGTEKFVKVGGVPISFEGEDAILIVASDITELIQIEKAFLQSEQRFRDLFESSKDPIFFTSVDGKFLDVNQAGETLFGYSKEELYTMRVQDCYLDSTERNVFQELIEKQGFVKDYEVVYKNRKGEPIDCLETTVLTRSEDGSIIGYQGAVRDVSEKKRLEEQIIRAQKMEAIGTLAGGIAHDFNNILATIMGYSSFLKNKAPNNEELFAGLVAIEKASVRASELTSQLLAYTRKSSREVRTLSVNKIVMEVHGLISKTFDKSIDIIVDMAPDLPAIEGDESQIHQILMNITVNAQQAMPDGGALKIETFSKRVDTVVENTYFNIPPGNYVSIRISDTGVGMDRETKLRVFEPYFTTKGDRGGSGLGMSVVFGIVKSHNGCILIDSSPDHGTLVTVCFPVSERSEIDSHPLSSEVSGGTEKILIIDDETSILEMMSAILEGVGYTVYSANSGRGGIKLYREAKPDLVILDFKMPEIDGRDVLEELMRMDSDVRVLIATGFVDTENRKVLMGMGAAGFIRKPFKTREIVEKVRKVLEAERIRG